jgi:hypothetical protein
MFESSQKSKPDTQEFLIGCLMDIQVKEMKTKEWQMEEIKEVQTRRFLL